MSLTTSNQGRQTNIQDLKMLVIKLLSSAFLSCYICPSAGLEIEELVH